MSDSCTGIFVKRGKGGSLRDICRSLRAFDDDIYVKPELVKTFSLVSGAHVKGRLSKTGRRRELAGIDEVCGLSAEAYLSRKPFDSLVAIQPEGKFKLGATGDISMRVMDLAAPVAKGTRGLIVAPPKAGKTVILEKLAKEVRAEKPGARIIVLLIDERPEEVTEFRRSVDAEVLSSSSDMNVKDHTELTELLLAHIQVELECGKDVLVLVDSITRMARAFNLKGSGSGRTMSGGVDASALKIPRQFFGLARNVENGGSVTIIATALVDTGSRMDQLIFEEFKGTGNSELVLDRKLAEVRIWPAVDFSASGTRREELLYSEGELQAVMKLRRVLAERTPREAMESLQKLLTKYNTNAELLKAIPVKK